MSIKPLIIVFIWMLAGLCSGWMLLHGCGVNVLPLWRNRGIKIVALFWSLGGPISLIASLAAWWVIELLHFD